MKLNVFLLVVGIQVVVITLLFVQIRKKTNNVLGVSVNTIDVRNIQKYPSGGLAHFYEPKPNSVEEVHKDWLFPDVPRATINKDALNERYDYSVKKEPGVFRIITIGDSFTYGQNVSTASNWTEVLEDKLNNEIMCPTIKKFEVINLGVGGYDTSYELERYKLRGQKYKPDAVVWFVTDLFRITEEFNSLTEGMKTDEAEDRKKGIYYGAWERARNMVFEKYGNKALIDFQIKKFKEFRAKYYTKNPLLFMTHWNEIAENLGNKNIFYRDIRTWADETTLLPDRHFNAKGHEKFAQEVLDSLIQNKLLPCE